MITVSSPNLSSPVTPSSASSPCFVSPWLSSLAYALAHYGVIPAYFQEVRIRGQEHLPLTGPVILAPTHRSRWDAIIVPYSTGKLATGREVYFMVSANEMQGLQGWLIRHLGGFPINTEHPGRASIRCGMRLLKDQRMVVVFPEGGIFQDGQIHPLKLGIAHMALQVARSTDLNVKIVPILVQYNQPVPTWHCKVQVTIAQPLTTVSYTHPDVKQETQQLTLDLAQALEELLASSA
jgi:1-acyl-sn-glycerol-3-phosphate acyltransferase